METCKYKIVDFSDLKGKQFKGIKQYHNVDEDYFKKENKRIGARESIVYETVEGDIYIMCHLQDCCEDVWIESINYSSGVNSLINRDIFKADENIIEYPGEGGGDESSTITFYLLATIDGFMEIRWCGESHGYYSEKVDLIKLIKG